MNAASQRGMTTRTLAVRAILTALVVVLQCMGQFIRLGMFSISLVLIPIVIGAAIGGTKISSWLGAVFGVVVLCTDAAAFLSISIPGTIVTVLAKGIACGWAAGTVFRLLEKKNRYLATMAAAIVCPLVNTGVFLLGCVLFFMDTIEAWGIAMGYASTLEYVFLGLVGGNFLVEMASNIILSPVIIRVLNVVKKQ